MINDLVVSINADTHEQASMKGIAGCMCFKFQWVSNVWEVCVYYWSVLLVHQAEVSCILDGRSRTFAWPDMRAFPVEHNLSTLIRQIPACVDAWWLAWSLHCWSFGFRCREPSLATSRRPRCCQQSTNTSNYLSDSSIELDHGQQKDIRPKDITHRSQERFSNETCSGV